LRGSNMGGLISASTRAASKFTKSTRTPPLAGRLLIPLPLAGKVYAFAGTNIWKPYEPWIVAAAGRFGYPMEHCSAVACGRICSCAPGRPRDVESYFDTLSIIFLNTSAPANVRWLSNPLYFRGRSYSTTLPSSSALSKACACRNR
jgi:hypothetical protein